MFYDILDEKRKSILPLLSEFKDGFYLAGGTALALQIGHRDSVDFDFFSADDLDTGELFEKLEDIFGDHTIQKVQDEKNTLTVIVDDSIKLSFFTYKYSLIGQLVAEEDINLASVEDIACMKLMAITSRSTEKDYVDLYYILQSIKLSDLLPLAQQKYSTIDTNLIIKSLVYFDDILEEAIIFKNNKKISFDKIKIFLQKIVKEYLEEG